MPIISKEEFKEKRELDRPILSLDYGEKRIGIAISDSKCSIALPSDVLEKKNSQTDILHIKELIAESNVQAIIIGMPYNMDGSEGEKCRVVKFFGSKVLEIVDINIIYWDERLSTVAQEKILINEDVSRKKRKKIVDKLAAGYFLQSFLDFLKN